QYGGWLKLQDETLLQLRGIVDGLDADGKPAADADARKIADLYASFMDEARVDSLGLKPLDAELARIDAIVRKDELPGLIAHLQWTKVQNRDPVKTYNPIKLAKLPALAPGYDWRRYAVAAKVEGRVDGVVVSQPSYLKGFAGIVRDAPLAVWKSYFKWHVLESFAPFLSSDFVTERFAFAGTVVRGIPENRPRWKRGLALVENSIGEA